MGPAEQEQMRASVEMDTPAWPRDGGLARRRERLMTDGDLDKLHS
jgi:hypothetical protein